MPAAAISAADKSYLSATTTAAVATVAAAVTNGACTAVRVSTAAEDDEKGDYNEPNVLVIENIAKAVIHSILRKFA